MALHAQMGLDGSVVDVLPHQTSRRERRLNPKIVTGIKGS